MFKKIEKLKVILTIEKIKEHRKIKFVFQKFIILIINIKLY